VVKNVAGFDVTRLSIGSWGTLGVITSVSARLFPLPGAESTVLLRGPDASTLLPVARAVAGSNLPLAAVELLDPGAGGEGGAALVVRLLGPEAQVTEMEGRLQRELGGEGSEERLERFQGEASRELHQVLNDWEGDAPLVLRLALLPSELGVLLEEAGKLGEVLGTVRLSAHVGSGILRVAATGLPGEEEGARRLASVLSESRERLEGRGGSMTVSVGPASLAEEVGAWGTPGPEKALMEGLKREFDPQGILAPGRFTV
jgi:glycolate oxidase FAD binding subunit